MFSKLEKATQITFVFILSNVLIAISFIDCPMTTNIFYSSRMHAMFYIRVTEYLLTMAPVFNFNLCFGLICMKAAAKFDALTMNWE